MPNVTFHTLAYPFEMDEFWAMQWPMLWADNFTSAPFVFFLDVDAVPVMPLRCQHFFDEEGRVLQYAFHHVPHPVTVWTKPCSDIFLDAQRRRGIAFPREFTSFMAGLDFMNFWPVVAPRWALPRVRRTPGWLMARAAVCGTTRSQSGWPMTFAV